METRAKKKGDSFVLSGAKNWITNAPIADIAIVWAKDDEGEIWKEPKFAFGKKKSLNFCFFFYKKYIYIGDVRGFIVERGMEGFTTPVNYQFFSFF